MGSRKAAKTQRRTIPGQLMFGGVGEIPASCPRCGETKFVIVAIHGGESERLDCAKCKRFVAFSRWHGRPIGEAGGEQKP